MIILLLLLGAFISYLAYFYYFKKNEPIIISIDGNIGSGKSTLLNLLKEHFQKNKNIIFIDEPVNEWTNISDGKTNILNEFYNNKERWSYTFQNLAFITRSTTLLNSIKSNETNPFEKRKIIISERSTETDKNIFAKMLFDEGNINKLEYEIYNYWYNNLIGDRKIKNIIYLRTLPVDSFSRIKKRGRNEEDKIPLEYIQSIHKYHDDWLVQGFDNGNICYIDGKDDFINDEKYKNKIIASISVFINSLEGRLYLPS